MNKHNIYEIGLEKTPANYESLSPLSFLERAASVYPDYTATVHGSIHKTWRETEERCRRLLLRCKSRELAKVTRFQSWHRTCRKCLRCILACHVWRCPEHHQYPP